MCMNAFALNGSVVSVCIGRQEILLSKDILQTNLTWNIALISYKL